MFAATRWIIYALLTVYIFMRTLPALVITTYRVQGEVPTSVPTELGNYFLHIPWPILAVTWLALFGYVAAFALFVFRQAGAKRVMVAALAADVGAWIWARAATAYSQVFTPVEQTLDALLFLVLISIIVLMILERQKDALT